ncbi:MAG: alpha/beta fold hydrolase [Akkermansiaceae bacterium]|nr:alpha/beta fold hydrolase [Akkermansiaceae bacterium]
MLRRSFLALAARSAAATGLCLSGCGPSTTLVLNPRAAGSKGETFGYRKWIAEGVDPDVVLIGIHGFCGASVDYTNLGKHLLAHQPETGLYAYEVRGQGSDPIYERRGDIGDPNDWYRDLFAFTLLVRERHPDAKVVWFGESMGSLIAAHAYAQAPPDDPPCDGLVLSSPIVRFRDDIPAWTPGLVQVAATTLPLARVSLETLAGGGDPQMTQGSHHLDQAKKNPYHVEQHTLRLIGALTRLIDSMNKCARTFHCPVLVLHGGNDYFNNDSDVRGFVARIPEDAPPTYKNYADAYHLLMYDEKRDKIFRDVERWVNRLRGRPWWR